MGMSDNMLACIRAIAENRIQDAKQYAICCCVEDSTKKNEGKVQYYKKLLENGSDNVMEVPMNIKGLVKMIDVSDFNENRYYLGRQQADVFTRIIKAVNTTTKLLEYGIPYTNSTLLSGTPGTGKTEFAKYTAYKLGLPYVYLNFSYLIDSYMGKTSQNIQRVFDFCKGMKCVLMLDEIDCIGLARKGGGGADGEIARITISLMQALDDLADGQIVIAATNRADLLDKALLRRFQNITEFVPYEADERLMMIETYMNSINPAFLTDEIREYANKPHTQADNLQYNGLEEHICYLPIPFSPVTGERIEFETVSNYNIDSDRIKEILAERDAVPKRRSNKNLNKITKLNEEIGKLTKGIADIIYAECEIYDESSVGCAAMVIENLIRKE